MSDVIRRLPPHERRRLLAVPDADAEELARRRLAGEPLQYLEGSAAFADFEVLVDERVLIPRPETEGLYELVTQRLTEPPEIVVDLGTGSGVLAIALARRYPDAEVHAVDLSEAALQLAAENALRNGVEVAFHHGDLLGALPERLERRVDLLVSNPPYVAEAEWSRLPEDVRHEPRLALIAGPKGTEVLERIAEEAGRWMRPGGLLVCEIGEDQEAAVREMFSFLGETEVRRDLSDRPRYVVVQT